MPRGRRHRHRRAAPRGPVARRRRDRRPRRRRAQLEPGAPARRALAGGERGRRRSSPSTGPPCARRSTGWRDTRRPGAGRGVAARSTATRCAGRCRRSKGRHLARRRQRRRARRGLPAGGYLDGEPVELPVDVDEPEVEPGRGGPGRRGVRRCRRSRPGHRSPWRATALTLTPRDIAAALTFDPGRRRAACSRCSTARPCTQRSARADRPLEQARRGTRRSGSGRGHHGSCPSRQGQEVLPETLAAAVLPVLTESGASARGHCAARGQPSPAVTTGGRAGLGVDRAGRPSSRRTTRRTSRRGCTNIHRAADLMDEHAGAARGQVFSLNGTVGERTAERGFAAGYIIDNGQLEVDFGGGVSQLATTTFNAAFFAGLEIVEHHPHSFYISRYPEGREATVAWGVKDLRFRNDSPTRRSSSHRLHRQLGDGAHLGHQALPDRVGEGPALRHQAVPDRPRPPARRAATRATAWRPKACPGFQVDVTRLFCEGGDAGAAPRSSTRSTSRRTRSVCGVERADAEGRLTTGRRLTQRSTARGSRTGDG